MTRKIQQSVYDDLIGELEKKRDESLDGGMAYVNAIYKMLFDDTKILLNLTKDAQISTNRNDEEYHFYLRAYCRSVFSLIEGTCAAMQTALISAHKRKEIELTYQEAALLREESYNLSEGNISTHRERLPLLEKIRFLSSLVARVCSIDFRFVDDDLGWQSLPIAEEIRDRLMHPRDHIEYSMNGEECILMNNAYLWFMQAISELILKYNGEDSEVESIQKIATETYTKSKILERKQQVRSGVLNYFENMSPEGALVVYEKMSMIFHREREISFKIATGVSQKFTSNPCLENLRLVHILSRCLLLSLFAEVNGICSLLNRMTLWSHRRGDIALTDGERALLEERRYYFRRGEVKEANNFNDLKTSFRLAFSLFPRCFGSEYRTDRSTQGWQSFSEGLALRNRLAHPRDPRDVFLNTSELACVSEAAAWFSEEIMAMMNSL